MQSKPNVSLNNSSSHLNILNKEARQHNYNSRSYQRIYINNEAYLKKEIGILTINQRTRDLEFKYMDESKGKIEIKYNSIKIQKKNSHPTKARELLCIEEKNGRKIFGFEGENRKEICNFYFNYISAKTVMNYQYEIFINLNEMEKRKICLLIDNNYLKSLFDILVSKNNCFNLSQFWSLVQYLHPEKIKISLIEPNIQITRSDELNLSRGCIQFNNIIKQKLLYSYDNLYTLFKISMNNKENENIFWKFFLDNQISRQTEIVGGLNKIYFTDEQKKIINENKKKEHKNKFSQFELVEKQLYFKDNYYIHFLNSSECDFSDKKIGFLDSFEKKEVSSIISKINNYSFRKIEKINYISERRFKEINQSKKNNYNNCLLTKNNVNTKIKNEINIFDSLNLMKMQSNNHSLDYHNKNSKQTLFHLNEKFAKIASIFKDIDYKNRKEKFTTEKLFDICMILRDLKSIQNIIKKNNNFNDITKEKCDYATKEHIFKINSYLEKNNIVSHFTSHQVDLIRSVLKICNKN